MNFLSFKSFNSQKFFFIFNQDNNFSIRSLKSSGEVVGG